MLSEEAQTAGSLCSTDIAPRHRYYGPFRRPLLFGRLPGLAGYTAYPAPPFSRREEEGFSSCSARPLPPCRRYHPVEVEYRYLPACDPRCCLHPGAKDSAFEISTFRGYPCVRLRCGPVTRSRPSDDSVDGLQVIGFPPPCHPSYKAAGSLPWWDCLPLNAPAFAGRTAPQRVLAVHAPDQRSKP